MIGLEHRRGHCGLVAVAAESAADQLEAEQEAVGTALVVAAAAAAVDG